MGVSGEPDIDAVEGPACLAARTRLRHRGRRQGVVPPDSGGDRIGGAILMARLGIRYPVSRISTPYHLLQTAPPPEQLTEFWEPVVGRYQIPVAIPTAATI